MKVKSAIRNYDVCFTETMQFLKDLEGIKNRLYIIDSNVWKLYSEKELAVLDPEKVLVLPINEERKSLQTVTEVYDSLMSRSAKRNMTMISIGGGIIQDITGFVASTLYRGINWIYVPTTLLAQSDSCIGSKTSLNYQGYKNLIGTFFPPNVIHINPSFLATLEKEDFYSGLGEVIKLHLMGGERLTQFLLEDMDRVKSRDEKFLMKAIRSSLDVKVSFFQDDEFDTGKRNLLNFGHCLGHAVESTSNFEIPHGQAVLIGILFANIAAKNRKLLSESTASALNNDVILKNIVVDAKKLYFNSDSIFKAMQMDKKRVGEGLALIMMIDGFKMIKVVDFHHNELSTAIEELIELLNVRKVA